MREQRIHIYDGNTGWSIDFCGNGVTVPADWDFLMKVFVAGEERPPRWLPTARVVDGMQKRQWWGAQFDYPVFEYMPEAECSGGIDFWKQPAG